MQHPSRTLRADIQCLRALAVASVVAYHFHLRGGGGGFIGVDVFFVISGYLMTRIVVERLTQDRFSYLEFVIARAVRIVPALLVLLAAVLVVGCVWLPPNDLRTLAQQASAALFFTSNLLYLGGGGYFDATTAERWLLHTWSLSVEWQFYLLYPLVLMALWAIAGRLSGGSPPARRKVLAMACLIAFGGLFAWNLYVTPLDQPRAFFSLATRAWEMLGGGLVCLWERPGTASLERRTILTPRWAHRVFAALLLALVVYLLIAAKLDLEHRWPGPWPLPAVLATMGLIASGRHVHAGWIAHPLPQALGRWSYSIYLWHWPIVMAMEVATFHAELPLTWRLAGIAASVALGALSFRIVEQPVSRAASGARAAPRVAFALVLCGVAIQVAQHAVEQSGGWLARTGTDRPFYEQIAAVKGRPVMPDDCINFRTPMQGLKLCPLHPEATGPRVLVYGDSHAQHLYAWFNANATRGVDFFTSSGCHPAPGFNRHEPGYHCNDYMARTMQLAMDPRYDTIVVAGNWGNGMNSHGPSLCRATAVGGCSDGTPATRAELVEANVRFWRSLLAAGKRVYVMEQVPFASFDVPDTLARERFWHRPLTRVYHAVPRDSRPYLDDVTAAMGPAPGFARLDMARALCDDGACRTMVAGDAGPTLIDNNHFAPAFVRQSGQVVLAQVR